MNEQQIDEWTAERIHQAYAHGDYEAIIEARKAGQLDHLFSGNQ